MNCPNCPGELKVEEDLALCQECGWCGCANCIKLGYIIRQQGNMLEMYAIEAKEIHDGSSSFALKMTEAIRKLRTIITGG